MGILMRLREAILVLAAVAAITNHFVPKAKELRCAKTATAYTYTIPSSLGEPVYAPICVSWRNSSEDK